MYGAAVGWASACVKVAPESSISHTLVTGGSVVFVARLSGLEAGC